MSPAEPPLPSLLSQEWAHWAVFTAPFPLFDEASKKGGSASSRCDPSHWLPYGRRGRVPGPHTTPARPCPPQPTWIVTSSSSGGMRVGGTGMQQLGTAGVCSKVRYLRLMVKFSNNTTISPKSIIVITELY